MAHPGVVFLLGITIATALYYMFTSGETENQQSQHNNGPRSRNTSTSYESTNTWTTSRDPNEWLRRRPAEVCSICLDTSMQAKKIQVQPCGHVFHKECIDKWIHAAAHQLCPNCRSDVL